MFFAVSGLFIIFIFCLGYPVVNYLCLKDDDSSFTEKFPLIMTTGFLINHLIFLSLQSLKPALLAGMILAAGALIMIFRQRKKIFALPAKALRLPLAMILSILLLYYFKILSDPLDWWDARSIWFFHAKMILYAQTISPAAGWHHVSVPHTDYPKLIPALAAQISYVLGYWNEYAPKLSIFLVLIPPVFWIFSFYTRSFSFLLLVLVLPLGLKTYLWNGGMDGFVAFYTAVSMLLLGRYFTGRRRIDLLSALCCLMLVCNLKNEGILIGLIGFFSIAATELLSRKDNSKVAEVVFGIKQFIWLVLILSPCVIWSVLYKHLWHLTNDLKIGTAESFSRMAGRLSDGTSFPYIIKGAFFHDESAVWLAAITFAAGFILLKSSRRQTVSWIPALITAVLYFCGIVAIYLLTPAGLVWHVLTSVQRTMLTVTACLIAGAYFILRELESAKS